jgi:hypothetical protein
MVARNRCGAETVLSSPRLFAADHALCYNNRIRVWCRLQRQLTLQSIIETIQAIARQRGRGDALPLIMLRQLDGAPGERISHLPIESELAQAWVALTGEPFRPHQAHALTALRRGEPVALYAADPAVVTSAYLLLYATVLPSPPATALVLAPDTAAAQATRMRLDQINRELPRHLRLAPTLLEPDRRPDPYARIVIVTPEALHSRLLRHHDRAWRLFWPRLQIAALLDVHCYAGVAGAHLADLLLRLQRIVAEHTGGQAPDILATLVECADPAPALSGLLGHTWRVIPADDSPRAAATLAVWRGAAGRLRESVEIATAIRRQGYHVHIACAPLESALLAPLVGDVEGISYGPALPAVHVLVAAGYPGSHSALRRMLAAGYQAVILVLGELPHEQALARQSELLISDPATSWPVPPTNAYVTARHLLCAATEQPLTEAEVEAWGAQEIVSRLVAQGKLVDLPDPEIAWKPTNAAGDPYTEFSLLSASDGAIIARSEPAQTVGQLDPTGFERWMFLNAALPPGAGGFRVLDHDEEVGRVTVRLETNGRRTYPLRRCQVSVRDERDSRMLPGAKRIAWGRVVVDEEVYGYREATGSAAPAEVALKTPLTTRWIAPACWFDVAVGLQVLGQFVGWSLAAALPLRALAHFTDVVPCYDHEARRLYVIDAQPGGNGLAAWTYEHAEELLRLAYDVALACRNDPLLDPLSRVDMDWLLALLGRHAEMALPVERARTPTRTPTPIEAPRRSEPLESPAPAPRILLTPAPAEPPVALPRRAESSGGGPPPPEEPRQEQLPLPPRAPSTARPSYTPAPRDEPPPRPPRELSERDHRAGRATPPRPSAPPDRAASSGSERRPDRAASEPPAAPDSRPARSRPSSDQGQAAPPDPAPPADSDSALDDLTARRRPVARPGTAREEEAPPDPAALIARLRRQREQREAAQPRKSSGSAQRTDRNAPESGAALTPRFAVGERIFCLPYGDGVVRASRIESGRELLTVAFPAHGELVIDPAVSLVRKLEDEAPDDDDLR